MSRLHLPRIVIDTREQLPYEFTGYQTVRKKLDTGDYSLEHYEHRVSVERKSHIDFLGCVGTNRKRFRDCLERLEGYERAAIVIECDFSRLGLPHAYSDVSPAAALGSLISWACRYQVIPFTVPNREWGAQVTVKFLEAFFKHVAGDSQALRQVAGE